MFHVLAVAGLEDKVKTLEFTTMVPQHMDSKAVVLGLLVLLSAWRRGLAGLSDRTKECEYKLQVYTIVIVEVL